MWTLASDSSKIQIPGVASVMAWSHLWYHLAIVVAASTHAVFLCLLSALRLA